MPRLKRARLPGSDPAAAGVCAQTMLPGARSAAAAANTKCFIIDSSPRNADSEGDRNMRRRKGIDGFSVSISDARIPRIGRDRVEKILVSACLLGARVRYHGGDAA